MNNDSDTLTTVRILCAEANLAPAATVDLANDTAPPSRRATRRT